MNGGLVLFLLLGVLSTALVSGKVRDSARVAPKSCNPRRSCCEPNNKPELCPGCVTGKIQTCVCAKMPYCCDTNWDLLCVQAVSAFKCDTEHDTLCNHNNQSCVRVGPMAGCNDEVVRSCVCKLDTYCCNFEWDSSCVDAAINSCNATTNGGATSATTHFYGGLKMTPGAWAAVVLMVLAPIIVICCIICMGAAIFAIRRRRRSTDVYRGRELVLHDEIFGLESDDEIFDELAEADDAFGLEDAEEGL